MNSQGIDNAQNLKHIKLRSKNTFNLGSLGKENYHVFSSSIPLELGSSREATSNPVFVLGNML
jgi:hypothetical protein